LARVNAASLKEDRPEHPAMMDPSPFRVKRSGRHASQID
jgi:hypothetical protein